jgi:hypothetical protein
MYRHSQIISLSLRSLIPVLKPWRYNYTMETCYPVFLAVIVLGIFFYVNLFMAMDSSVDKMLLLTLKDEL